MEPDANSGVSTDFALAMDEVLIAIVTGSDLGVLVVVEAHLGGVTQAETRRELEGLNASTRPPTPLFSFSKAALIASPVDDSSVGRDDLFGRPQEQM